MEKGLIKALEEMAGEILEGKNAIYWTRTSGNQLSVVRESEKTILEEIVPAHDHVGPSKLIIEIAPEDSELPRVVVKWPSLEIINGEYVIKNDFVVEQDSLTHEIGMQLASSLEDGINKKKRTKT